MKCLLLFILALLTPLTVSAQMIQLRDSAGKIPTSGTHLFISPGGTTQPGIEVLKDFSERGIGVMSFVGKGVGVWSGAATTGGVGVWAAGSNGARALVVQGDAYFGESKIIKTRVPGQVMKLYDPTTGTLRGVYEFSIE